MVLVAALLLQRDHTKYLATNCSHWKNKFKLGQVLQYNGFYIYLANREFVSAHAAFLGIFFFLEKRERIFDFVKVFDML